MIIAFLGLHSDFSRFGYNGFTVGMRKYYEEIIVFGFAVTLFIASK
jgi:hypothetical protein